MYDVFVIGGGPGGYTAAARAAQLGLKTALVEKENLGGTCANWGCIPTKALLKNAEAAHLLQLGRTYGFTAPTGGADYAAAQNRSRQVAKRQERRVEALLKGHGVNIIRGTATITAPGEVEVQPGGEVYQARNIIVASGGKPKIFPGWEIDGEKIITSREALLQKELPASVAIIGAGPIGMEFATVWRRYGVEVTVIEAMPGIMPLEDEEISKEAEIQFAKAGIAIRTGTKVESFKANDSGVELMLSTTQGKETMCVSKLLVAVGTAPDLEKLGLDAINVILQRGFVAVDDTMATNIPGIYAIGDVTGKMPLAHTASAQAMIAADTIAGRHVRTLVYENIPRCIFGHFEVASVGLTEQQARGAGHDVKIAKANFLANGKAVAINENAGFVKVVADGCGKLLGVHMIGPHVTEMIAGATTLVSLGITAEQAGQVVYPHPTLSEVLMEAIRVLSGQAIH